jgi:hypothetical protein
MVKPAARNSSLSLILYRRRAVHEERGVSLALDAGASNATALTAILRASL